MHGDFNEVVLRSTAFLSCALRTSNVFRLMVHDIFRVNWVCTRLLGISHGVSSMTSKHPSLLIASRCATYDPPTTSILWVAAMVNFKTSPTDSKTEQGHVEWKSAQKRARSRLTARTAECRYQRERPEARGGNQFQVPRSNLVQGWHLLSRNPHQNCLSSGSKTRLNRI